MPTNAVRPEYAEWLATPPVQGMLVTTMEISGAAMTTGGIRLANRLDHAMTATDEMGVTAVYHPIAFSLSKPSIRQSTELSLNARIDAMDGAIYRLLSGLRPDDLTHDLHVAIRAFVDPMMLDRPVWPQPIRLRCELAKVSMEVVEMTLVGGRLPNKRAGTFYDLARFVGVRPF